MFPLAFICTTLLSLTQAPCDREGDDIDSRTKPTEDTVTMKISQKAYKQVLRVDKDRKLLRPQFSSSGSACQGPASLARQKSRIFEDCDAEPVQPDKESPSEFVFEDESDAPHIQDPQGQDPVGVAQDVNAASQVVTASSPVKKQRCE